MHLFSSCTGFFVNVVSLPIDPLATVAYLSTRTNAVCVVSGEIHSDKRIAIGGAE